MITITEEMGEFGAHINVEFFLKRKNFFYILFRSWIKAWKCAETKSSWNFQKISGHQSCESPTTYLELSKTLWLPKASEFFWISAPGGWWVLRSGLLNSFFYIVLILNKHLYFGLSEVATVMHSVCYYISFWRLLLQWISFLNWLEFSDKSALA